MLENNEKADKNLRFDALIKEDLRIVNTLKIAQQIRALDIYLVKIEKHISTKWVSMEDKLG